MPRLETPVSSAQTPNAAADSTDGADMRSRILEVTIEAIDRDGEAAVRLSKVARAAGASPSIVAYYFGNREQLVAEAQAVRYLAGTPGDIEQFAVLLGSGQTADELRHTIVTLFRSMLDEERRARRANRLVIVLFDHRLAAGDIGQIGRAHV